MKVTYNDDGFIIYNIKDKFNILEISKEEIEKKVKKMLLYIKRKFLKNICGFYDCLFYSNEKYGFILEVNKESDLDFFPDLVDLKLKIVKDSKIYLKFNDYFLIDKYNVYYYKDNYYVDIDEISEEVICLLSDFYEVIYGDKLEEIKGKLKLVVKTC